MNRVLLRNFVQVALSLVGICIASTSSRAFTQHWDFFGLGGLVPNSTFSHTTSISDNGLVVAGAARIGDDPVRGSRYEAFRWTKEAGMVGLGTVPGSVLGSSFAMGINADGSAVVGWSAPQNGDYEAFRWTNAEGMQGLGRLQGDEGSEGRGVSGDGSTVIGVSYSDLGQQAFRWTAVGGMTGLGYLPNGGAASLANDVSGDGLIVVGECKTSAGLEAFRWTATDGMVGLGDLPGGAAISSAHGISADGSTIVGSSYTETGMKAFRWTANGGMQSLGTLPGGYESDAYATSKDGSVVIGIAQSSAGMQGFIWTEQTGMMVLKDFLSANGNSPNLESWLLPTALDISGDGRAIVSWGENSRHEVEAWIAAVPEPSTGVMAGIGCCLLCVLRKRFKRA